MKTPESPLDLDSLLQSPSETATESPAQTVPPPAIFDTPLVTSPSNEFSWDNEEILDIPRASATSTESPLALDDLLSTPPAHEPEEVLEAYPPPPPVAAPLSDLQNAMGAAAYGSNFGQEARPTADPSFSEAPRDFSVPGTEPSTGESSRASVFAQDSYVRNASNTYVMATPDRGNKGRLAKVFFAAALVFGLLGIGYFTLSGLVKDWLGLRKQVASSSPVPTASRATVPSAAPSQSAATTSGKTASPSAAAVASASVKAAASATPTPPPATPTPAATSKTSPPPNQTATNKTPPTPAPATGNSGHAVGASEGSLAVQVASFKSAGEAQQAVSRLKNAGVSARIVKAEVPGMGTRFRVQAGRFTNETEASKYASELRAKGVARDFIVTGYQN